MATVKWVGGTDGDWSDGTNWSTGDAPASEDDVIIPRSATVDINEGLGQSAVDLDSLTIEEGCSINIGTATSPLQIGRGAAKNIDWGGTGTTYLQVAGDLSGGTLTATGSGTLYLASYSTEETIDTLNITGTGTIYIAWKADESAMIDTLRLSGAATVYVGEDVLETGGVDGMDVTVSAGTVYTWSMFAAFTMRGGTVTFNDVTPISTDCYAGTVYCNGSGGVTITDMTVYGGAVYYNNNVSATIITLYGGVFDLSSNANGCTIVTIAIYGDAVFNDPHNANAVGAVFKFYGTDAATATVNFGQHREFTTGNIA